MKWYTDYLSTYEKPYSELPPRLTDRVKKRIKQLQAGNPLVSVVVIAHNEESRIFAELVYTQCYYRRTASGTDQHH